jgi:hypothetical protein
MAVSYNVSFQHSRMTCYISANQTPGWTKKGMLLWVEQVPGPYVATVPDGVVPILLLDSYRCHMMTLVVTKIRDLGVEVENIPGVCTGLCQPVDVGVNKPFKNHI